MKTTQIGQTVAFNSDLSEIYDTLTIYEIYDCRRQNGVYSYTLALRDASGMITRSYEGITCDEFHAV